MGIWDVIFVIIGILIGAWLVIAAVVFLYRHFKKRLHYRGVYTDQVIHDVDSVRGFWVTSGAFCAVCLVLMIGIGPTVSGVCKLLSFPELEEVLGTLGALLVFFLAGTIISVFHKCAEQYHQLRRYRIHEQIDERKAELKKWTYVYDNADTLSRELEKIRKEKVGLYPESEECHWTVGLNSSCSCRKETCRLLSDEEEDSLRVLVGVDEFLELRIDELQDSESGE